MPRFTHLHTHSHYSLLTALPKIDDLVNEAKKCGMASLALTDSGNLYGAIEFYKACKKKELKPIIGVDFYVAARTRKDMQAGIDNKRTRLVLLAMNETGYRNLVHLVTKSHLEGFYYKPRIDRELIQEYSAGLIAISPSFSGEIAQSLNGRNQDKAEEIADFYKKTFSDRLYIEITKHPEIDNQMLQFVIGGAPALYFEIREYPFAKLDLPVAQGDYLLCIFKSFGHVVEQFFGSLRGNEREIVLVVVGDPL